MVNAKGEPKEHLSEDGKIRPCNAKSEDACRAGGKGEEPSIPVPPNMTEKEKEAWADKINAQPI